MSTPHIYILPMKALHPLWLLEVGDQSLKTKNGHLGNLYKNFSLWCTFLQELTIHDHGSLLQAEKF